MARHRPAENIVVHTSVRCGDVFSLTGVSCDIIEVLERKFRVYVPS